MNATQLFGQCETPNSPGCSSVGGNGGSCFATAAMDQAEFSKANPSNQVFIQGWMLLSLAVSIFVPRSSKLLWFLRTHLNRYKDQK